MKLLDLFCKAGGGSSGYDLAGFTDIIGVDIQAQPRYPYTFVQGDALHQQGLIDWADVIHASPPCQRFSVQTQQHRARGVVETHPDLIQPIREILQASGKPYIMENVVGAPLLSPILLCGSMFGSTRLRRHRLFESNIPIQEMKCDHSIQTNCISVAGHAGGKSTRDGGDRFGGTAMWREIMHIDWMTGDELAEAIPPFYTEYIGCQILEHLGRK